MKEKIVFVEVSCLIELSYMMKKKHVSEMLLPSKTITLSNVKNGDECGECLYA